MKRLSTLVIAVLVLALFASAQTAGAASAPAIVNVKTPIKLNGKDFVPGAPIKTADGNLMVPLKPIVKQLGMELSWVKDAGLYRINGLNKVILLLPGSQITAAYAISSSNFGSDSYTTGGSFKAKMEKMPVQLLNQGGIYYVSLKWLAGQYGLALSSQNGVVHVSGKIEPYTTDHTKPVYDALIKKGLVSSYSTSYTDFLRDDYNDLINYDYPMLIVQGNMKHVGKTYWLYNKFNAGLAANNNGVTLPRFAKLEIIDAYSFDQMLVRSSGKLYRIDNSFFDHALTQDPKKQHKWSNKVWNALADYRVFVGMTKEQAVWGWGEPNYVNNYGSFEQWVYGSYTYLYFDDGILSYIQN